jgi:multiple sugar transport system substrate-binding protein
MRSFPVLTRTGLPLILLVATIGIATTSLTACSSDVEGDAAEIVFASGPDDTGIVQGLLDVFNEAHRGEIRVTWRVMDRENNAHRRQLIEELESGQSEIDLIASDIIWTAELAEKRWVEDVTDRFYADYERDAFLKPALDSATYRLRIWGVPWVTDAGLLFYRRDKLAECGFEAPPKTWDELARMANEVKEKTGTRHGFVFQGAAYEGGTVNAAEFIWSAGGELVTSRATVVGPVVSRVAETDAVRINSEEAARGLDLARKLVVDGVSPAAVTGYREREALDAFLAGDAVFLRSWPYVFGMLKKKGFTADQFGVAPLPAASEGGRSASCLGGWNLMLNASSSGAERNAAWKLALYLTAHAQQKRQAREAGLLPILLELYDDPELAAEVPVVALGRELTAGLHTRPRSPLYSAMSERIAEAFNETLAGTLTGAEATKRLDEELRAIVRRNR